MAATAAKTPATRTPRELTASKPKTPAEAARRAKGHEIIARERGLRTGRRRRRRTLAARVRDAIETDEHAREDEMRGQLRRHERMDPSREVEEEDVAGERDERREGRAGPRRRD